MSDKFDESDKETQEQKKVTEKRRGEVSSLNEKLNCIAEQVDRQEQYFRRNGLWPIELLYKIRKTQML